MRVGLGDSVEDTLTGFTGIAVCRSEWLFGCVRIGVQSRDLKDGKPQEIQHIDEGQLAVKNVSAFAPGDGKATSSNPGGPQQDARRAPDASR